MELYLDTPLNSPLDMRYVRLLDAAGSPIDGALLDVALPGRDGLSVSILMHPGRIKTGVGPNSSMGMALHEGQTVTLEVADPQLQGVTKKTWTVAPALRQRIDPQHWIVHAPASGSREPVRLEFGAGLDAGAAQLIAVAAAGRRLPGKSMLVNGETGWRFTPSSPWRSGSYAVRVHPAIEDPAGNRLCSAFEAAEQSAAECDADVSINFSVR
ncbi:hypothetical protein [Undibacterium sp.]|uniref:hypothetical protein n=1 Tax=Undibacterium sp. TaxID=1914977 RepID=UPI00374D699D